MELILVGAAALSGIALGDLRPLPAFWLALAAAMSSFGALLSWRRRASRTVALVTCAAALGGLRASTAQAITAKEIVGPLPWLSAQRLVGERAIAAYLPEPQASLASGVLLGGTGQLDASFRRDLQRSGLAHLVAIDGFKQVVVAATVGGATARLFGRTTATLTSVVAITGYTVLTGAHPSAVRAGLMVGLASVASLTGRVADPLTSLVLAALAMATLEPGMLFDVGLQLSLSATLGIVLLWPGLRRRLRRVRRMPRFVAEPVGLTLAVMLASLPVTLVVFQQVSLISPVAHILAVPLLPAALLGAALLTLVVAIPLPPLAAALVAWLAWVPTTLLAAVIHAFGGLPAAAIATGRLQTPAAVALAGVLLAWGVWQLPELRGARRAWKSWRFRHPKVLRPIACTGACVMSAALLVLLAPDGRWHAEPLDVGRGQALLIRAPSGRLALVVAGRADALALVTSVADHLAVWEHRLDTVVALDPNAKRAVGATLSRYAADQLVEPEDNAAPIRIGLGGETALEVNQTRGVLIVRQVEATSAPTTSAARPGSAN